ncbi:glycosyltransferase [Cognatishimia maritima]|uniref:Glycosyltransferase involved in cell wall bisynthesis n=1 Tax=Cognatishimia maritima TaxID=870908 RepID=A0A1M5NAH6_9RHOB|nr:glycosyltransferase [Cognatishimia maritima]SHG85993.1 Glycosyltransferase involved in cell wall bisynthesis [Cognatishimia maritima]
MSVPGLFADRRVALIHYWLVGMRGGEKVLEALCRMFPQADIFTHVVDPKRLSETLLAHDIRTTRVGRMPFARRLYQNYLPMMPRALEELDLTGYDLVISSEAGPAKGIIPPPGVPHLCYCHSPMRYIWDHYARYKSAAGPAKRAVMGPVFHRLRQWDATSAARVDQIVANSSHVAARIKSYWRRDAGVVPPPVAVDRFAPVPKSDVGDYYLWAGEMVPYKRPDIAIDAFRLLDKPLLVIGGPDRVPSELARRAGPKTRFLGRVSDADLKHHLARCRALIFPGEEDFGIVPVEAMASGRPVIAFGKGGVRDSVVPGKTGFFFQDQSASALVEAVREFEESGLEARCGDACVQQAAQFSERAFQEGILRNLSQIGVC